MSKRKEKSQTMPRVHPELEGFNVEVNALGEVRTVYDLDKLNQFLNRTVRDKKFKGRTDIDGVPPELTATAPGEEEADAQTPAPKWGEQDRDPDEIADDAEDEPLPNPHDIEDESEDGE